MYTRSSLGEVCLITLWWCILFREIVAHYPLNICKNAQCSPNLDRVFIFQLNYRCCFLDNSCCSDVWRKTNKWLNNNSYIGGNIWWPITAVKFVISLGCLQSNFQKERMAHFLWKFSMVLTRFSPLSVCAHAHTHTHSHMFFKSSLHNSVSYHF